ncbi:thiosulfate sulfurtransferase GlpE [Moritella marina ATCC 15381]|uniref:Thiosulfate sulfurtransferase GlpE n=1 Tax=Moritella marina ATCC 15381 TaxID=1202962 RepID=A0A5J6WMP7_MORMI|nr:thiosulfate sulfurtransferase GlpE [Moritella marina]QFI39399.1 thiosulfate sulfurtransferase GlpE [Moritella marina ATCC 15381]
MDSFKHISINEVQQLMSGNTDVKIVDIRDPQSFSDAHIEDSLHLTDSVLGSFMQKTDFDTPVVVVCYHGRSSQGAAQYLVEQGFEDVYSMDGGFEAWRRECAFVAK